MNKKYNPLELSYYRLSLLSFLKESHPERVKDNVFIKSQADLAAEIHSNAIKEGHSQQEAEELANEALYQRFHFSKHDTLVHIFWNEFSDFVPQSEAKEFAIRIQSECDFIFVQYSLTDEFVHSFQYDRLYTELTGFVDLWLEENEL